jgi:hypothetical protein
VSVRIKMFDVIVQRRAIEHVCKVNAIGGIVSEASWCDGAAGVADCKL